MKPEEVLTQLRRLQEKYKDVVTHTFEVRISDMVKDAADTIQSLIAERNALLRVAEAAQACVDGVLLTVKYDDILSDTTKALIQTLADVGELRKRLSCPVSEPILIYGGDSEIPVIVLYGEEEK